MASVTQTANVTNEERRQLGVLAFIKKKSARELAGDGVRMLLNRNKEAIAAVKLPQPDKTHARRKSSSKP